MHSYTDAKIKHSHSIHFHRLDSRKLPTPPTNSQIHIFRNTHKHHFFNSTCHCWDSMSTLRLATRSSQLTPVGQSRINLRVGQPASWKSCAQFLWTSTVFTVSTSFCFASNTARLALQLMRSFTSLRIQNAYLATLKYNSKSGSLTQPQSRTDLRAPSPSQLWKLSECPASFGRPHCSSHTPPG